MSEPYYLFITSLFLIKNRADNIAHPLSKNLTIHNRPTTPSEQIHQKNMKLNPQKLIKKLRS